MKRGVVVELELPADYRKYRFPKVFDRRLQTLLEQQNVVGKLSNAERKEAEELVNLAEFLSLVRMRADRVAKQDKKAK